MSFKEVMDRVLGIKSPERQEAERDDMRLDRRRLDHGVERLKEASEKVRNVASEFDQIIGQLVVDLGHQNNRGKPDHAKTPPRSRKT